MKKEYHDILKIGYSKSKFHDSRERAYNTHNYGYDLLCEVDGDEDLEATLHKYFDSYNLDKSYDDSPKREWFDYNRDIINMLITSRETEYKESKDGIQKLMMYFYNPIRIYNKYINDLINILKNTHAEKGLIWDEKLYKTKFFFSLCNTLEGYYRFWRDWTPTKELDYSRLLNYLKIYTLRSDENIHEYISNLLDNKDSIDNLISLYYDFSFDLSKEFLSGEFLQRFNNYNINRATSELNVVYDFINISETELKDIVRPETDVLNKLLEKLFDTNSLISVAEHTSKNRNYISFVRLLKSTSTGDDDYVVVDKDCKHVIMDNLSIISELFPVIISKIIS